jgi:hypothetical protein
MVELPDMHFFAMISELEFTGFKFCIADLRAYPSYLDFILRRDGYFIGLSWAGEVAVQVEVPLRLFTCWVDLTGSPCTLASLDDFAMRRWVRARHPEWNMQLVSSEASSRGDDRGGLLCIPVRREAVEAWKARLVRMQSDIPCAPGGDLARVIAEECLDPAM